MALQLFKIASTTVESPVHSVDFTSIPQGYTDLLVKVSARSNQGSVGYTAFRINSTTTNYSQIFMQGDGSSTASYTGVSSLVYILTTSTGNNTVWDNSEFYIPNYTSSNNKSISFDNVVDNGTASNSFCLMSSGLWSNSSAITQLTFYAINQSIGFDKTFQANSTFTLYGIL